MAIKQECKEMGFSISLSVGYDEKYKCLQQIKPCSLNLPPRFHSATLCIQIMDRKKN